MSGAWRAAGIPLFYDAHSCDVFASCVQDSDKRLSCIGMGREQQINSHALEIYQLCGCHIFGMDWLRYNPSSQFLTTYRIMEVLSCYLIVSLGIALHELESLPNHIRLWSSVLSIDGMFQRLESSSNKDYNVFDSPPKPQGMIVPNHTFIWLPFASAARGFAVQL